MVRPVLIRGLHPGRIGVPRTRNMRGASLHLTPGSTPRLPSLYGPRFIGSMRSKLGLRSVYRLNWSPVMEAPNARPTRRSHVASKHSGISMILDSGRAIFCFILASRLTYPLSPHSNLTRHYNVTPCALRVHRLGIHATHLN